MLNFLNLKSRAEHLFWPQHTVHYNQQISCLTNKQFENLELLRPIKILHKYVENSTTKKVMLLVMNRSPSQD